MKQIPEQLLKSLNDVKGFDKELFLNAHGETVPVSIRLHPQKTEGIRLGTEVVPWCATGRYLEERPVFTVDPLFHSGAYYVQEASSMFVDHMLRQLLHDRSRLRVLDLCAAPGGKSTLIASLLEDDSLLICNEVIRSRASILEENITRWGYMNTWVTSNDPGSFKKLTGYFDVIVVDAPCSGSGMFRKDEKAIDEWSENNVALCSQRQQRILADIWPSLKEDGVLIYSTCSYSVEENEDVLDWLGSSFKLDSLQVSVKDNWGIEETLSEKNKLTGYRFFPGKVKGEGLFMSAVRKKEDTGAIKPVKYKSTHDKKAYDQCHYLLNTDFLCLSTEQDYIAIEPVHEADYHLLKKHLYLRKTGTSLGVSTKKDWLPSHDVALSVSLSTAIKKVDLNKEQALKFLKKEAPELDGLEKGWYVVCYNGLGIGWIKALGNRINNYLPKNWRIRMEINDADWA